MPQVTKTETSIAINQADGSPIGCTFCLQTEGPFVTVQTPHYVVHTGNGPVAVDVPVVLCGTRIENGQVIRRGCAGDVAAANGFYGPDVLAASQAATRAATDRCAELEAKVAELTRTQMQVVPVEKLMELIEENGGAAV